MKLLVPVKHPKLQAAERLETEICELAAHLAAATCRFLLLIAEFDRLDGWLGHRSCAQWLSWRCGLSNSTAREHVRVAHGLERFSVIREAFATGRLSYSKVRAITRVAHAGNEAELVETALVTTAAQLDRIVRAMRTATPQQVRDRHRDRALSWWWDDDGMLRISVRLDPDEGAAALAALRAACSAQPHPTADGTPIAQLHEHSPGAGPRGESTVRPHAAVASGTTAPAAAEFAAGPRTAGASAKPLTVEPVVGLSAAGVSAKPREVEAATGLSAARAPAKPREAEAVRSLSAAGVSAKPAEVEAATGLSAEEVAAGTHVAGTAAGEKITPTAGIDGSRSDHRSGTDARRGRGDQSFAGPVSASAEAPTSVPPHQEAKTSLADAFGAIMRSYLGSVARDATEPDAFQVVVLTQITGAADADAAPSPGGETATSHRGEGVLSPGGRTATSAHGEGGPSSIGGTVTSSGGEGVLMSGGGTVRSVGGEGVLSSGSGTVRSVGGEGVLSSGSGTVRSVRGEGVLSSGGGIVRSVRGEGGPSSIGETVRSTGTETGTGSAPSTEVGTNAVPVEVATGKESALAPGRAVAPGRADIGRGAGVPPTGTAAGGLTDDAIPLPPETVLRIACTAPIVQAVLGADHTPMDIGRKSRKVGTALRRALRLRDAGRCRFPGCSSRRRLHAHHVRHWVDGGETALANLISLCPAHHWAVHEGGHRVWGDDTGRVLFARPDGRLMEPAPPMGPADGGLATTDERVPAGAVPPCWDGTPLDLDHAVLALTQMALAEPEPAEPEPAEPGLTETAGRSPDETGRLPGISTRLSSEATSCREVSTGSAA